MYIRDYSTIPSWEFLQIVSPEFVITAVQQEFLLNCSTAPKNTDETFSCSACATLLRIVSSVVFLSRSSYVVQRRAPTLSVVLADERFAMFYLPLFSCTALPKQVPLARNTVRSGKKKRVGAPGPEFFTCLFRPGYRLGSKTLASLDGKEALVGLTYQAG